MNLIVSPQAQQDLADIWHFIALDNLSAADRVLDAIKDQFIRITEHTELGRRRDELALGLRSMVVRRYRRYIVLYRRREDAVDIVRVLHGARNLNRALRQQTPH